MLKLVTVTPETPQQPDVERLIWASDRRSESVYPGESRHGPAVEQLVAQKALFVVARSGGTAIGCGGFIINSRGDGELKRIFVEEASRGRGVGRLILATLERAGRYRGVSTMRLETGVKSTEAVGLYRHFGYRERGPFGSYRADPLSIFMEKNLT